MDRRKVYLGGKITGHPWRAELVRGIDQAWPGLTNNEDSAWPVLVGAIDGRFDYVGPYPCVGDHGAQDVHGTEIPLTHDEYGLAKSRIPEMSFRALRSCDIAFFWLESSDCHGSLVEIGYALGLHEATNRPIVAIGSPPSARIGDIWFAESSPYVMPSGGSDLRTSWRDFLIWTGLMFDSPVEKQFYDAWWRAGGDDALQCQYVLPGLPYRLDFAHVPTRTAIEIDGFSYHGDARSFEHDRKRDRALAGEGWQVHRFAAKEVMNDAARCAREALDLLRSRGAITGGIAL